MIYRGVGAPPGNYEYWLHYELAGEFTQAYERKVSRYKDNKHNYRYARYRKHTMIDEFIVVRTSKKCYRVMYYNADFNYFSYFSEKNYRDCANHMKSLYQIFKKIEQKE